MIISAQLTATPGRRRLMHRSYVVSMQARALAAGAVRLSLMHVHWDCSAGCEKPNAIEIEGRLDPQVALETVPGGQVWHAGSYYPYPPRKRAVAVQERPWTQTLTMDVKCRQCPTCLRHRAAHWRMRAQGEILAAPRTWFGTLTLSSEAHNRMSMQAHARLSKGGTALLELSPIEQFREEHSEISKEITKWLKRVRFESNSKLRYCLVAEAHKSGLPHYHILIHEGIGSSSVYERTLRKQWHHGFSKFNLVHDKRAAAYVCKYLSKSSLARVRASIDYGNPPLGIEDKNPRGEMPPILYYKKALSF